MAIVLTVAIFSYLVYVFFVPPTEGGAHLQCVSKTLFNLNCFSCGMTRFVCFAMHGDFVSAFQYNVFGPVILLLLTTVYFLFMRWALKGKAIPNIPMWVVWAVLAFILIYSILRNLPIEAIQFLAPPS